MVGYLRELGLFVAGAGIAAIVFSLFLLPILYGLPKAIAWAIRGWLRWQAPALYLVAPAIWGAIFLGAGLSLAATAPAAAALLGKDKGFASGLVFGVALLAARALFSRAARDAMEADFRAAVAKYLTARGAEDPKA
jgi:hypothetical protein